MDKIIGIGNALVDIILMLENDQLLKDFGLPKGSMQLVDYDMASKVMKATEGLDLQIASGGSAANTIHGLAQLGAPSGYIGTIGKDELGEVFKKDMSSNNINPLLSLKDNAKTGRAITLVSKDAERTFATYLGAAAEINEMDVNEQIFSGYKYLHIEGYLLFNHELLMKTVKLASAQNMIISLDMASFNVVEANIEFLNKLVPEYINIIFANEEEAKAFTGKEPEGAIDVIAGMCDVAVVKVGSKGSMVKRGEEKVKIDIIKTKAIDTTGAGDLYAAGFLYGFINNKPLKTCGDLGALLAARVIEVAGAKITGERWKEIREYLKNI
ncbi:MAG: adenosine kinase [Bacteroidales bacterium]|nr:adenosine kinase [Bacteroidales bacterium]